MSVKCYKELIVWQKSILLVEEIYRLTGRMPRHEGNGLISQMQRAAVSISSNIAEGHGRDLPQYRFFLVVSRGYCVELETQMKIAGRGL